MMSNASCSDTDGSFYCNCIEGFSGNGTHCDGRFFCQVIYASYYSLMSDIIVDVNECNLTSPVCHVSADCFNTYGSFFCVCRAGYTGNGSYCDGE